MKLLRVREYEKIKNTLLRREMKQRTSIKKTDYDD